MINDDPKQDSAHEHKGHDHPQTIDAEPLEQTRSARLLREQEKSGAVPIDEEDDEA